MDLAWVQNLMQDDFISLICRSWRRSKLVTLYLVLWIPVAICALATFPLSLLWMPGESGLLFSDEYNWTYKLFFAFIVLVGVGLAARSLYQMVRVVLCNWYQMLSLKHKQSAFLSRMTLARAVGYAYENDRSSFYSPIFSLFCFVVFAIIFFFVSVHMAIYRQQEFPAYFPEFMILFSLAILGYWLALLWSSVDHLRFKYLEEIDSYSSESSGGRLKRPLGI